MSVGGKIDHGLSHLVPPNKGLYSAETYVGNWYEVTEDNTAKLRHFLNKRECEELAIQKSQIMVDMLLKPVRLTERRDGLVYFGDSVQIISPGPDCASAEAAFPFKKLGHLGHLALSASVPPSVVDHAPYLNTDSIITLSKQLFPVVRNSFVIERPNCPTDNTSVLHYGDVFRIRAMPTQHWPLYLHSAPGIPLHAAATHSGKPLVRFSDTPNPNTFWRLMPLDPMDKLKIELGIAVPLKRRLLLQHALSGHNLSIEPDYPVITYFGCEYEATVNTKRNRVRNVSWENHWVIDTERGWSKPDPEVLAQAEFSAAINANDINKSASEEEKEKERKKREEEEEEEEEEAENERMGEEEVCPSTVDQFEKEKLAKEFEKMRVDKGVPGHVQPYDWRTAPQPHAQEYRISENEGFYPNMKWNCGDTQCCHDRTEAQTEMIPCPPKPKCYEYEEYRQKPK